VLALLLAACGAAQPAQVATSPSPTAASAASGASATATVSPTLPSITPLPSATSIPATATPVPPSPVPPSPTATPQPGLDAEPYATLGDPDAPVTIYEFSDFGCPACRQFALFTFPTLKQEYIDTGKVRLIFKDFPIVSQHGGLAAQAAECAGEQGYYWEMHDQLFANPAEWDASPDAALAAFRRYAEAYGMDAEALVACVAEERYKPEVDRDFEEGQELRLFGTPTFIINRLLLSGAQSPEVFAEVIDNLLAEQEGE
jgi:protein-disulfide isomerase